MHLNNIEEGSGAESVKSTCLLNLTSAIRNQAKELLRGKLPGFQDVQGCGIDVVSSFMALLAPIPTTHHEINFRPAFESLCLYVWSFRVFGFRAGCFESTEIS